ncbi:MAG: hypothetical protein SFU83_09940 [Meiothermus sp.]|nr:hypothetical protein [Meiothermus sp.]
MGANFETQLPLGMARLIYVPITPSLKWALEPASIQPFDWTRGFPAYEFKERRMLNPEGRIADFTNPDDVPPPLTIPTPCWTEADDQRWNTRLSYRGLSYPRLAREDTFEPDSTPGSVRIHREFHRLWDILKEQQEQTRLLRISYTDNPDPQIASQVLRTMETCRREAPRAQAVLNAIQGTAERIGLLDPMGNQDSALDWLQSARRIGIWSEILQLTKEREVEFFRSEEFPHYIQQEFMVAGQDIEEIQDSLASLPRAEKTGLREILASICQQRFLEHRSASILVPALKLKQAWAGGFPGTRLAFQGSSEAWAYFELLQEFQTSVTAKCKRPGCPNAVAATRKGKAGRPPEYCSVDCRKKHRDDRKEGRFPKDTRHKNYKKHHLSLNDG